MSRQHYFIKYSRTMQSNEALAYHAYQDPPARGVHTSKFAHDSTLLTRTHASVHHKTPQYPQTYTCTFRIARDLPKHSTNADRHFLY
jgi:hypothetical protein